jgi:CRISPR system Cascade subunit CasC
VSSQCLKRHWREDLVDLEATRARPCDIQDGYRSRKLFEMIFGELKDSGIPEDRAKNLAACIKKLSIKKSKNSGGNEDESDSASDLLLKQAVYLSRPEVNFFIDIAKKINETHSDLNVALELSEAIKQNDKKAKEKRKFREDLGLTDENLEAMHKSAIGFTSALFGRMVTSDLLARVNAPVHVAHAFTVHAANTEMDYFTVVDDLNRDDETGAAHANQTELGAGLYYGYVAVDVPLLVSNLTGCKAKDWQAQDGSTARRVLEALIDSILRQSPGAKKGSTAPYAWADVLYLETGRSQPRALSNAFLDALRPDGRTDLRKLALDRMAAYVKQLDEMYGSPAEGETRQLSTTLEQPAHLPPRQPVPQAVAAALDAIFDQKA